MPLDASSRLLNVSIGEKVAVLSQFIAKDLEGARAARTPWRRRLLSASSPAPPTAPSPRRCAHMRRRSPRPASGHARHLLPRSSPGARRPPSAPHPSPCPANAASPATRACSRLTSSSCFRPTPRGSATACGASRRSATASSTSPPTAPRPPRTPRARFSGSGARPCRSSFAAVARCRIGVAASRHQRRLGQPRRHAPSVDDTQFIAGIAGAGHSDRPLRFRVTSSFSSKENKAATGGNSRYRFGYRRCLDNGLLWPSPRHAPRR